ncbi:RDD family protein [Nocardioides sp.]|uniref:RDD family protein n=1 Tax=Nocardioides sp. TaxID=35761 RepID=UPI002726B395|nr:RDD family protein [Nocardioides sp.]MDO9454500.1 RDD family protein [Nocardioides sp.]
MNDAIPAASWGRRVAALLVDWVASTLVAVVLVGGGEAYFEPGSPAGFITLGVYVVEAALFTWLIGGSFGKVATGLRVVPADGVMRPINPLRLIARQVMVALVIPPLVFRPDGRGLHDVVAGTATVPVDVFRALVAGGARPGRR